MIANFSDRLFPFDNKSLDQSEEYIALTKQAIYPPLYRFLETNHSENNRAFNLMDASCYNDEAVRRRAEYIQNSIQKLFVDPYAVTVHGMKADLDQMTQRDEVLKYHNEFIEKLFR